MNALNEAPRLTVRLLIPSVCKWIRISRAFGPYGTDVPGAVTGIEHTRLHRQREPSGLALPYRVVFGRSAVRQAGLAEAGMSLQEAWKQYLVEIGTPEDKMQARIDVPPA